MLKKLGPSQPELEELRNVIDRQAAQLTRLCDDLFDVSRINSGRIVLRKQRMAIGAVLSTAIETSRPLIESRAHELEVRVPSQPIEVDGDLVRLTQVFSNLLNNAANYTPKPGQIAISASVDNGEAIVRVRDTGIGLSADQLPHIFDMFAQAHHPLQHEHAGLGIGLSLAKKLVELHGGTIAAQSAGANRGSEFVVRLPIALPLPVAASAPHVATQRARTRKRRILVADDNVDSAQMLAMVLRHLGHEVHLAHDGAAALAEIVRSAPDIAILDIGMPKLNGYELAKRVRTELGARTTLVALSGWGQDQDKRMAREAGFDFHLTKPADLDAIAAMLAQIN
jgi:CheY-like chemotaxis protein